MKCPVCEKTKSSVTNSRTSKLGHIRRRRECSNCGERFTTYEMDVAELLILLEERLDNNTFIAVEDILMNEFPTHELKHSFTKSHAI